MMKSWKLRANVKSKEGLDKEGQKRKELSPEEKVSIYRSTYVHVLTYSLEFWILTKKMRLWIQTAKMCVSRQVAGPIPGDRVRSKPPLEEGFCICTTGTRPQGTLEDQCLSAGLEAPWAPTA